MGRDRAESIATGEARPEKQRTARAFCTVPTTLFGTKRIRALPGSAVRVLLWCEAGWHPKHAVVLPQRRVAAELGLRRSTVTTAVRALVDSGLLTLLKPATRPRSMGCNGPGRAAVFDLPHRRVGGTVRFDQGDIRLPGYVKLWATDARALARSLSDAAARVATIAAAVPRASDGTPLCVAELDLSGDAMAQLLPGISPRTANRAVVELCALGDLKVVSPRNGQHGARFAPAGRLTTCISRRRRRRPLAASAPVSGASPPAWFVHGGSHLARKPLEIAVNSANSKTAPKVTGAFRAKRDAENRGFAPNGMPKENLCGCNDTRAAA
jgi:hypothetical protein